MEPVFFFKHMTEAQEQELQEYFSKKLPRIQKLLSHYPEDAVVIHVKGEYFVKHSAFEVEITLKLPTGTSVAHEASHLITKAVDLAVDRIDLQLKKNTEFRRNHRGLKARSKAEIRVGVLAL